MSRQTFCVGYFISSPEDRHTTQDEIIFLPVQGDRVECKVTVHKEDVITVYFEGHFSIGASFCPAPSTVPDHDFHLMV